MSKRSRIPVLVVGDGAAPTGFSRVIRHIFAGCREDFDIHQLAVNYFGDPHAWDWKLYPAGIQGDPHGRNRIGELAERVRPELVFLLNDVPLLGDYVAELEAAGCDAPRVLYFPIEAGPLQPESLEAFAKTDRLVVYTEHARREVERAARAAGLTGLPGVEVIPHGVSTDEFHPLGGDVAAGRRAAKRHLLPQLEDPESTFIVLNANRNQPRKRIDTTLKGFSLFARDKGEDVRLYLHMGRRDAGWDLVALARRLGVADRLILTTLEQGHPRSSESELNRIYNACDVGLNTSTAEGWGLVSFEHAATGAAQIVSRHATSTELWSSSAVMVEPVTTLSSPQNLLDEAIVSPQGVAEALELLYGDKNLLAQFSAAAFENAVRPEYRWDAIARRWRRLFFETLGRPSDRLDSVACDRGRPGPPRSRRAPAPKSSPVPRDRASAPSPA